MKPKITISGVVSAIFQAEIRGSFEKRVIWVKEEADRYPEEWEIEFQQGDVNALDGYAAGDKVTITAELRGRAWKDRVFNTVKGVAITGEKSGRGLGRPTNTAGQKPSNNEPPL